MWGPESLIPRTHIKPHAGAVVCNLSAPTTIEEVEVRNFWEAHGPTSLAYDGTKKGRSHRLAPEIVVWPPHVATNMHANIHMYHTHVREIKQIRNHKAYLSIT